jgi:hypothetical protein
MKNCLLAKYHSDKIENYLKGIVEGKFSDSQVNFIEKYAWDLQSNNLEPCLECANCYDYYFYKKTITEYFRRTISKKTLELNLVNWDQTKLFDEVLTHCPSSNVQMPQNMEIFNTDKEKIYLDQNIISIYIKDKSFKELVLSAKNNNYQFVYSPSHIEEIFKIEDKKNQDEFIDSIREITDNVFCVRKGLTYVFVKEDPTPMCQALLRPPR